MARIGAGEGVEFAALLLPCPAVVTGEVGMVAQLRVHVRGQHLAMRVDLDRRATARVEQLLEIDQVMARDEHAGARLGALFDFGRAGLAHDPDVSLVEHAA